MVLLPFFTALVLPTAIRPYPSDSSRLKSSSIQSGLDALVFQAYPFPIGSAVMRASWRDPWPNTARAQIARLAFELRYANLCGRFVALTSGVTLRGSMLSLGAFGKTPLSKCMT
jgi:hypothetical protein